MKIEKDIKLFDDGELFSVAYTKENFETTDTAIAVYDKYKISILLSEGLNAVVGDKVIKSGKNSVVFFRPDELHFGRVSRAGVHSYLDFFIPLSFFEKFCKGSEIIKFITDKSENRVNYIVFDMPHQKIIFETAIDTIEILKSNDKNSDMKIFSLMLRIILLCSDFYEKQKYNPIDFQMPDIVTGTMMYISENYKDKLSLEKLASRANCSVTYLSRIFKQYVGITIYNYIIATRIGNAQIMLNEDVSVTEVCFACGFDDCSNFIRTFKKITGKTPLQFQKSLNM
ncbi:MAG: AraC family transcriptional regulator [Clostridia bacterium]|nr:AraC family transcriptional regulator [Clostridia bacterium]